MIPPAIGACDDEEVPRCGVRRSLTAGMRQILLSGGECLDRRANGS